MYRETKYEGLDPMYRDFLKAAKANGKTDYPEKPTTEMYTFADHVYEHMRQGYFDMLTEAGLTDLIENNY